MRRAAVWFCWGQDYLRLAAKSAEGVKVDRFLICPREDPAEDVEQHFTRVIRVDGFSRRLRDKSRLAEFLPAGYESFVFLDADTLVLGDLTFAFERAEQHGIAIVPAPNYNLAESPGFGPVMDEANQPRADQMQYNTGVIFFHRNPRVLAIFARWAQLCATAGASYRDNDQPFFSLAMEQLGFLPYVLSPAYNFRGNQGDLLAGGVRIWHNHIAPPPDLNDYAVSWPPRRYFQGRSI